MNVKDYRVVRVVSHKMEKGEDGKQRIWKRCKLFFEEPDAERYWELIKKYHDDGRLEVLRQFRLVGGWGCPEQMKR